MKGMAFALLLAAALVASGCGSVAPSAPGAASTPSPRTGGAASPGSNPQASPAAALTEADTGRAVQVKRGEVVSVTLHEVPNFVEWSRPASSDGAVLAPVVDTRAASVRGVTLASFQAAAPGTAQLSSSAGPVCPPNAPCPAVSMAWAVAVTVT
jgi:hypothetical protein